MTKLLCVIFDCGSGWPFLQQVSTGRPASPYTVIGEKEALLGANKSTARVEKIDDGGRVDQEAETPGGERRSGQKRRA
jgi:hypothetical protein